MIEKIKILTELTKLRITSFVTITTALGFISYSGQLSFNLIPTLIGILLLACGSAAINHYQERDTDALMERTKNRPIPSRKITPGDALSVSIFLVVTGSLILFIGAGWLPMILGLINLIWYNGIYTPLKKINPLAIIPGSIVGAIPPAVGWVAAGGSLLDPQLTIIAFFFFIWQIPHFWLLLLVLDKDYERAGFPTLTKIFNHQQLARITFIWIIATVVSCFLIPLFGIVESHWINLGLFASGVWLCWDSVKLLQQAEGKISFRFAFMHINYFALFVVLLLSIDKLVI